MNPTRLEDAIRSMPPCDHWRARHQDFNILRSEVGAWMAAQPEVRQALFNLAKERGWIQFNPATRTWCGVQTSALPAPEPADSVDQTPPNARAREEAQ